VRGGFVIPLIAIIAIILGILAFSGVFNARNPDGLPQCGTVAPGTACFGPTLSPAATATATAATTTAAPPVATATTEPSDGGSTFVPSLLLPPEDFTIVGTAGGKHTVSWVWPSGRDLDPTFFRVSVQGEPNDFEFTGPGDNEFEVPAACGSNPNFLTLDAFNTDVDPEQNSQSEEIYEVDPGC
jgi:hypothetical protein